MREDKDGDSGNTVPRFLKAAAVIASGLILCAPAAFSLAEITPDNIPKTQAGDGTAAKVAKPPADAIDNTGAIKDVISRTITSFGNDIRDAYHRELIGNPNIDGEITVSFTVRPGGDVTDVKVEKSSLNWPPLEEEILNRIKAWKFPPFEGEPIPAYVPYKFGQR